MTSSNDIWYLIWKKNDTIRMIDCILTIIWVLVWGTYMWEKDLGIKSEHEQNIFIFYHLATLKWHTKPKSFLMEDKGTYILHGQWHGYWCPGDARSQGISGQGIDIDPPEYSGINNRTVNHISAVLAAVSRTDYTWRWHTPWRQYLQADMFTQHSSVITRSISFRILTTSTP